MKKKNEAPVVDESPIALCRAETLIEYIPLSSEEKIDRLNAAASIYDEIGIAERQIATLADDMKSKKTYVEGKYEEARTITLEARDGTRASDYFVIVERHPEHPMEMLVWRPPLGRDCQEIVEEVRLEGVGLIEHREAQGCILQDTRAMTPAELASARAEDWKKKNPELPFDGAAATSSDGPADDAPEGEPAEAKSGAITCCAVLEEGEAPALDSLCGEPASRRARGLCGVHKEAAGKDVIRWTTRRKERQKAAAAGNGAEHESAGA